MYISNLKLWNFRKFGGNDFDLEKPHLNLNFNKGLNVLIGENDSGKSAILDAIKLVLKTHSYEWIKVQHEDFYNDSERLRIEILFKDLKDEEAAHFIEWLSEETYETEDGILINKPYLKINYDISRKIIDEYIAPTDITGGSGNIGNPLTAEAREYLKTTYLKPLRDAKSELIPKRNSRLAQILQSHETFINDEEHLLLSHFIKFNLDVENYFNGKDSEGNTIEDQNGLKLKEKLNKLVSSFNFDNMETKFSVGSNSLKSILETLGLNIVNETNPGLGTLNRLFMATELLHLNKNDWSGLRLGLIEELEAHLHPQAQMRVIESLQNEKEIQLILTTHSPNICSKIKLENLILCDSGKVFSLAPGCTKLNKKDYIFLEKFLDVTKSNLFFSKGVIFVEGWAEEILLPSLAAAMKKQRIINKTLTEAGISIVNIGNIGFTHYSKIFLRKNKNELINTPVAIITDSDVKRYKKIKDKDTDNYIKISDDEYKEKTKEKIAELSKILNDQNVKSFIAPEWTLEYSLFNSTSFKKEFCNTLKEVHPKIDINKAEKELAKKLIKSSLKKTEIAYILAQKLDEETITIEKDDVSIKYLTEAIRYVIND